MPSHALEIRGLAKSYRRFTLGPIDLTVPRGAIYGFVGPNGAGKTTTIDLVMGMGAKKSGTITVLGCDHLRDEVAMKRQVGYVSPDLTYEPWGRVGRAIQFVRGFYPTWDAAYCDRLLSSFHLDPHQRIRALSYGERIKLSLILALSWRPMLLILDEPTAGLDAIAKQQMFTELLAAVRDEDRSVLISSHQIADLERYADYVGMIKNGRMILEGATADVVERYRIVDFVADNAAALVAENGLLVQRQESNRWRVLLDSRRFSVDAIRERGATDIVTTPVTLEDLFVALGAIMNTRRLIVDFMRRSQQPLAVLLFAYFWWMVELRPASTRLIMAGSMWLTFFIGPAAVFSMLTPDAVRLLPISRREIWLARWWLSVVTPVTIAAVGKLLGIALAMTISGDAAPNWPALLLSLSYDLAYASLFLGLVPWMSGWRRFIALVAYIGGLFWPVLLAGTLPTRWSDVAGGPIGLVVAVALALGISSYRFSPRPVPSPGRRESAPVGGTQRERPSRSPIGDTLTGLQKLIWSDWVLTVRNLAIVLFSYILVVGGFTMLAEPQASLVDYLRAIQLLPFDRDTAYRGALPGLFVLGFLFIGAGHSSTLGGDFIKPMARALRALPIGTGRLLTVLIGLPVLAWITLWALLLLIHIGATGRLPATLQVGLLALLSATDVFARALQLRWRRDVLAWHLVLAMVALIGVASASRVTGAEPLADWIWTSTVVVGLFATATLLNYLALTRSRAPYARPIKGAAGL